MEAATTIDSTIIPLSDGRQREEDLAALRQRWKQIVSGRYGSVVPLDPRGHIFYVEDKTHFPEAGCVVVKYLERTDEAIFELKYAWHYTETVGPKMYTSALLPDGIEMVMEVAGASLLGFSLETLEEQLSVAYAVAELLSVMEQDGVIHGDVKPGNVLVFTQGREAQLRLADFGCTKTREEFQRLIDERQGLMGTCGYIAPEYFRGSSYSRPHPDIFAYGMLVYHIVRGNLPDKMRVDNLHVHRRVMMSDRYRTTLEDIPLGTHPALHEIILSCTEENPSMRPESFTDILSLLKKQ